VAYVTPIGSAAGQVEYRLTAHHGCGRPEGAEARFSYHADGSERPLVWTGRGLAEVGITPGSVLDETQFEHASWARDQHAARQAAAARRAQQGAKQQAEADAQHVRSPTHGSAYQPPPRQGPSLGR